MLASLSTVELNYVLATINVSALLDVAEAHVLKLLTDPKRRLHELGVLQRAALIDALQKIGLRYQPERQRAAANIVLATAGAELSQLKVRIFFGSAISCGFTDMTVDNCHARVDLCGFLWPPR